jgi:phosphatidylinositol-3-phosphatase
VRRALPGTTCAVSARSVAAALALGAMLLAVGPGAASPAPQIGHVFVIVLENEGYDATFGSPSADPYLAKTLPSKGVLLTNYYGIGHVSNDNYIAMVSGQSPNADTQGDCLVYSDFVGTPPTTLDGQAIGQGCVYPVPVQTIGNQLSENGLDWKGYMEDMGNIPSRESATCGHPALNSQDGTQTAVSGDGYATRHDPFVYFHSITDDAAYCNAHVVSFAGLAKDLTKTSTTPQLSFIVPNLCNDGHDWPCKNQPSGASALADVDAFLSTWVPRITGSPAFKKNGLLVVNFDESDGPQSDSSACCNETPGPNTPLPGITGMGGGRVGAVLLSPFIRGGTVSATPYNHYSLLASIEGYFGLPRLGYAATTSATFGSDVFNK